MITEKDLIGQLEGFPIQVVEKMLERQVQQGNIENVTIFQHSVTADKSQGGFTWSDTAENQLFWIAVIDERKFDRFFQKYPLNSKVWIRGNEDRSEEVINELIKRGGINNRSNSKTHDCLVYTIDPVTKEISGFT